MPLTQVTSGLIVNVANTQVTGVMTVAQGGTGTTSNTGTGSVVLSNSPALTTPNIGTPSAATLTNATGLPLTTGVTGILPIANGGTNSNATATAGGIGYGTGTAHAYTSAGTSGQLLASAGTSAPTWYDITGGGGTRVQLARQAVSVISTNTQAAAFITYVLTSSVTLVLPVSPSAGDWVRVVNASGTITPIVSRNGSNIMSLAEDLTINSDNASVTLTYVDATRGWVIN